jgi:hypothetical protein
LERRYDPFNEVVKAEVKKIRLSLSLAEPSEFYAESISAGYVTQGMKNVAVLSTKNEKPLTRGFK